jgi:hypothetical protein
MPIFLELFSERRYHHLLKFLQFADNKSYDEATCGSERLHKLKPILYHLNVEFRSVYTPECDVSVDECLMIWKVYIPPKHARFGTKSYLSCSNISSGMWVINKVVAT